MEFRRSLDFDSFLDCKSIAASTEEILWSDDDTIIAEQEVIWNEGNILEMSIHKNCFLFRYRENYYEKLELLQLIKC